MCGWVGAGVVGSQAQKVHGAPGRGWAPRPSCRAPGLKTCLSGCMMIPAPMHFISQSVWWSQHQRTLLTRECDDFQIHTFCLLVHVIYPHSVYLYMWWWPFVCQCMWWSLLSHCQLVCAVISAPAHFVCWCVWWDAHSHPLSSGVYVMITPTHYQPGCVMTLALLHSRPGPVMIPSPTHFSNCIFRQHTKNNSNNTSVWYSGHILYL